MSTSSPKYLISFDLDGTLLNDKKTISFRTKRYIKKLISQGHIVTFSSGRSYRNLEKYAKELGITAPLIMNNGALIYNENLGDEKIIHSIDLDALKKTTKLILPYIDSYLCETYDSLYYDDEKYFNFVFFNLEKTFLFKGDEDIIDQVNSDALCFVARIKEGCTKEQIEPIIKQFNDKVDYRFWWGDHYFEIVPKGVSKAHSIAIVAEKYNIPKENIIVFGDAENDIEMLQSFQHSFLMKNGHEKLRPYAKYITKKDNNHNGIVQALKSFFRTHK